MRSELLETHRQVIVIFAGPRTGQDSDAEYNEEFSLRAFGPRLRFERSVSLLTLSAQFLKAPSRIDDVIVPPPNSQCRSATLAAHHSLAIKVSRAAAG